MTDVDRPSHSFRRQTRVSGDSSTTATTPAPAPAPGMGCCQMVVVVRMLFFHLANLRTNLDHISQPLAPFEQRLHGHFDIGRSFGGRNCRREGGETADVGRANPTNNGTEHAPHQPTRRTRIGIV